MSFLVWDFGARRVVRAAFHFATPRFGGRSSSISLSLPCHHRILVQPQKDSTKVESSVRKRQVLYMRGPQIWKGSCNELAANVGCLKHKHLVQFLGWCPEGKGLVLVYEHMANGNLDKLVELCGN
ncbi:hypothetical protein IFM89_009903 [Coptis chinensis]|uniref:Serine-threonine/tyrosine-protein kinase catalytic domain-containing protein n=1 Tax=Coptis chinensis TaxID=261450 RepID=A0A835I1U7_9MAGN|nr:hypothetical protein IFM89_009903 [Coptis chinensis]